MTVRITAPALLLVLRLVTVEAQRLQVVPVQRNVRVVHVLRCQLGLVVHLISRNNQSFFRASLTQAADAVQVTVPAFPPWP